jgi:hypothetical protein
MAVYCGWIAFEWLFIFFMYPETHGRTLEELTFCESSLFSIYIELEANTLVVFEDKELADQAVLAVEKEIHADAYDPTKQDVVHAEHLGEKQIPSDTV